METIKLPMGYAEFERDFAFIVGLVTSKGTPVRLMSPDGDLLSQLEKCLDFVRDNDPRYQVWNVVKRVDDHGRVYHEAIVIEVFARNAIDRGVQLNGKRPSDVVEYLDAMAAMENGS